MTENGQLVLNFYDTYINLMSKVKPSTCSILIYLVYILQCHQQGRPIWQSETLNHKQFTQLPFIFLSLFTLLSLKPVWDSPPVWNLRAVIWFPFSISSLVFLPSPLALSQCPSCHFSGNGGRLFFQASSPTLFLFRNRFFLYGSCWADRRC